TKTLTLGNPLHAGVYLGPVINENAVRKYELYLERIRNTTGARIHTGGQVRRDGDFAYGYYVEPTVAELPDKDHELYYEEMFLPILLAAPDADLSEALALSNRAIFGLTAGLFSRDESEVRRFLDEIEAGVTYVNRRTGATTGAWPGVNPFGGWK